MKLEMEAMALVQCKEAINQGGALLHILWLSIVKVYRIQEVKEGLAVDEQCWADNIVFTFLLTAILFLVYRCLWFCTSKNSKNCWTSEATK